MAALLALAAVPHPAHADERIPKRPLSDPKPIGEDSLVRLVVKAPVLFYRNVLSGIYGSRCRMHPSCSRYSLEAIEEHGILAGAILTFDRLLHEGNEYQVSPVVVEGSGRLTIRGLYVDDPVDNNTFWW